MEEWLRMSGYTITITKPGITSNQMDLMPAILGKGSYYLKSDGKKMAQSEWAYDSSYQSRYYQNQMGLMPVM